MTWFLEVSEYLILINTVVMVILSPNLGNSVLGPQRYDEKYTGVATGYVFAKLTF